MELRLRVTHRSGQAPEDFLIRQCLTEWFVCFDLSRDGKVKVTRDQVIELEETRSRKHEVSKIGGIRRKQVQHDCEKIFARQCAAEAGLLGVRGRDVHVPAYQPS
jgi:hypothetical protein